MQKMAALPLTHPEHLNVLELEMYLFKRSVGIMVPPASPNPSVGVAGGVAFCASWIFFLTPVGFFFCCCCFFLPNNGHDINSTQKLTNGKRSLKPLKSMQLEWAMELRSSLFI